MRDTHLDESTLDVESQDVAGTQSDLAAEQDDDNDDELDLELDAAALGEDEADFLT